MLKVKYTVLIEICQLEINKKIMETSDIYNQAFEQVRSHEVDKVPAICARFKEFLCPVCWAQSVSPSYWEGYPPIHVSSTFYRPSTMEYTLQMIVKLI